MRVSLKIEADDWFPRIINRKIHFRYIEVYKLGSLPPSKKSLLSTWRRDAAVSLDSGRNENLKFSKNSFQNFAE